MRHSGIRSGESYRSGLSVVIPAFNESHRLPETLEITIPYMIRRFATWEVIVVDDGSTDQTCAIVERMATLHPQLKLLKQERNLGKGAAVRRGCLAATCDFVLFMDADLATPIEEVEPMLDTLLEDNAGAVVGVRTYQEDESKYRRVVGLISQLLAHLIVFEKAVIDSQCGFKCFRREVAHLAFSYSRINGGMFDVELFYLLHRLGVPVRYQPVRWTNKPGSRINIAKCIVFDPIDLVRIRLRGASGLYKPAAAAGTEAAETARSASQL